MPSAREKRMMPMDSRPKRSSRRAKATHESSGCLFASVKGPALALRVVVVHSGRVVIVPVSG